MTVWKGRLRLRGRASLLFLEGCWFDSPGLHVVVTLGKILNPTTAPDVLVGTLHDSQHHPSMNVFTNYCKSIWPKASAKCPKCKFKRKGLLKAVNIHRIITRICSFMFLLLHKFKVVVKLLASFSVSVHSHHSHSFVFSCSRQHFLVKTSYNPPSSCTPPAQHKTADRHS